MGLPGDLAEIDALLDDPRFFEPFRAFFDPVIGRPSIPMETYLRMMFLKYRYRLGFEPLCREVATRLAWRRFCRVPLGTRAPHPTTLMKITSRCGAAGSGGAERGAAGQSSREQGDPPRSRCGPTPRWWRPTWPTRPTRACWPRAWPDWPGSPPRSRRPAWRPAPPPGTGPGRCAVGPMTSPPGCADATTTPRKRSRPSTAEMADHRRRGCRRRPPPRHQRPP